MNDPFFDVEFKLVGYEITGTIMLIYLDYFIKPFYGIFIEAGIFMESFECCSPEIGLGKREDQKTANKNIRTLFDLSHVFFGEGLKHREGFSGVKLKNNTTTTKQLCFFLEVHFGGWHNFETSRYF